MKKYTLSTKGEYDFDTDMIPLWYLLREGAKSVEDIRIGLQQYTDCFAVSKTVERGMDDLEEIGKWVKKLAKQGLILEVASNEVAS